jgi:hypothetical protein
MHYRNHAHQVVSPADFRKVSCLRLQVQAFFVRGLFAVANCSSRTALPAHSIGRRTRWLPKPPSWQKPPRQPTYVFGSAAKDLVQELLNPETKNHILYHVSHYFLQVLGIRYILMHIRIRPYLWLMNPDSTWEKTPFFFDFKAANKKNVFTFFSHNLHTGTEFGVYKIIFLDKIWCSNGTFEALFHSPQHIYEKREGSGAGSRAGSGSARLTNGSGSGTPKHMQILQIRIRFRIRLPQISVF